MATQRRTIKKTASSDGRLVKKSVKRPTIKKIPAPVEDIFADINVSRGRLTSSTLGLYRKVVLSFVAITAILIAVVLYFTFISAKIEIYPAAQKVQTDFVVNVVDSSVTPAAGQVAGNFISQQVVGQREFSATGKKQAADDVVGTVTIYNNYRLPQALIATTRLLTADNILLRIKDRVDVPVGGFVQVAVYPDDPAALAGKTIASGSRLIIPGLSVERQDDIYAQANGEISSSVKTITFVSADDLTLAASQLTEQLIDSTLASLGNASDSVRSAQIVDQQLKYSATVDQEVEKFSLELSGTLQGLVIDREALLAIGRAGLDSALPDDRQILTIDKNSLSFRLDQIDLTNKTAAVAVQLEGTSIVRLNSPIFDKDKLKGLRLEQVESYFLNQPSVERIKVDFFPFWIKKIPSLPGHIDIIVKTPDNIDKQ